MSVSNVENSEIIIKSADSIKIIQITDTHILDDNAPSFNGFDTSASLLRIVKRINENEPDTDLILLTGDLVHEATNTSYQKLANHLLTLTPPVFCFPGNHDDVDIMNTIMVKNGHDVAKTIKVGSWLIVLLNTCVIGEHRGELSEAELNFLRTTLEENLGSHCLVALHHHPVPINSPWMDAMALTNAQEFWEIIDDFEHVRAIIWGHIHQEFELHRDKISLLGTPSTCLQFIPKSDDFAVDEKPPGYRKLELQPTGILKTKVNYLTE